MNDAMPSFSISPAVRRAWSVPLTGLLLGALILAAAIVHRGGPGGPGAAPGAPVPPHPAIEAAYGVRIDRLVVTADGGMVDLRYTVVDPDRAQAMMNRLETLPVIVGRGGVELRLGEAMHHKGELIAGRSAFILYANAGSAVRSGDRVWVRIGAQRLGPIVVW